MNKILKCDCPACQIIELIRETGNTSPGHEWNAFVEVLFSKGFLKESGREVLPAAPPKEFQNAAIGFGLDSRIQQILMDWVVRKPKITNKVLYDPSHLEAILSSASKRGMLDQVSTDIFRVEYPSLQKMIEKESSLIPPESMAIFERYVPGCINPNSNGA